MIKQRKKNWFYAIIALCFLFYFSFCVLLINHFTTLVTDVYFDIMGDKAADMASVTAKSLAITDEDVARLKSASYASLPFDEANVRLKNMYGSGRFNDRDISYVYVYTILDNSEIKYYVDENDKDIYGYPVGTPLDVVYLMDVPLNQHAFENAAFKNEYYTDKNRYAHLNETQQYYYRNKTEGYSLISDEWGEYISGFAPIYTTSGQFAGVLGVKIFYDKFIFYTNRMSLMFVAIFVIPTLFALACSIFIYIKYIKALQKSNLTDGLTGLYNRRYYDELVPLVARDCFRDRKYLSLIMIDIDYFKAFNDAYGHQMGDVCLKGVSTAIKNAASRSVDIVLRYGGEEILVILKNTDSNGAQVVASNIAKNIKALQIPHKGNKVDGFVTVSQGIFTDIPSSNSNAIIYEFTEKADKALYQSKNTGRNKFTVYTEG